MRPRTRLGMLTPSSNTVLEPACAAMARGCSDISLHFSRFRVTDISLDSGALGQFDTRPMLEAASLLADARVDAICWNGTSAGWLGFDVDRRLCAEIAERTAIPATSAVLAIDAIFRRTSVRRFALVSPYVEEVQDRIVRTFRAQGYDCVAERHLGIRENFAFAGVSEDVLQGMILDVSANEPDAVIIFCTNLNGAALAAKLERKIGIPIYDSTAAALRGALEIAGSDPARIAGWGSIFGLSAGSSHG